MSERRPTRALMPRDMGEKLERCGVVGLGGAAARRRRGAGEKSRDGEIADEVALRDYGSVRRDHGRHMAGGGGLAEGLGGETEDGVILPPGPEEV